MVNYEDFCLCYCPRAEQTVDTMEKSLGYDEQVKFREKLGIVSALVVKGMVLVVGQINKDKMLNYDNYIRLCPRYWTAALLYQKLENSNLLEVSLYKYIYIPLLAEQKLHIVQLPVCLLSDTGETRPLAEWESFCPKKLIT